MRQGDPRLTGRRLRKVSGVFLALVALAVGVAACTGGGDSTPIYALTSGGYELVTNDTPFDGCWTDDQVFPPVGIPIRTFQITVADPSVTIVRPASLAAIVPPFEGIHAVNAVSGSGSASFTLGTNCRLAIDAFFSGAVVADDTLDIDFTSTLTAQAITGTSSSCATYIGTIPTSMGVPFPTLDPPQSGTCSFRQRGRLTPYP